MVSGRAAGSVVALLMGFAVAMAGDAVAQRRVFSTPLEQPKLAKGERDLGLVEIDIKINAEGQLTALRPTAESAADLVPALEKAINGWRFLPARRDGEAVDWATRVSAQLKATPVDGGFALVVNRIGLNSVWLKRGETRKFAPYPLASRRQREEAWVLVLATPHLEGGGADVLTAVVDGKPASKANPFLQAASETVSAWPYEVLEWDGQRYAEQICAPMSFSLGRNNHHIRQWSGDKDAQQEACRKMPGGVDFEPIKLAEDVIGRRL